MSVIPFVPVSVFQFIPVSVIPFIPVSVITFIPGILSFLACMRAFFESYLVHTCGRHYIHTLHPSTSRLYASIVSASAAIPTSHHSLHFHLMMMSIFPFAEPPPFLNSRFFLLYLFFFFFFFKKATNF